MKELWSLIQNIVAVSYLSIEEKENVLRKLDEMLGSNILEYKFPLDDTGLLEDESLVYTDIVRSLNEGRSFPKVKNDAQYQKVVDEIFAAVAGKPDKRLQEILVAMDAAYNDGDWDKVNKFLKVISKIV